MPEGSAHALREQPEERRPTKRVSQGLAAIHGPGSRASPTGVPVEQLERFPGARERPPAAMASREGRVST